MTLVNFQGVAFPKMRMILEYITSISDGSKLWLVSGEGEIILLLAGIASF